MTTLRDDDLLAQVDSFLARTGMAPTRFGREAMGEASLIARMREGRSLSLRNANKLLDFIASHESVAAGTRCTACTRTGDDPKTLDCRHINCPIQEEREEQDLIARGVLTKAAA